MHNGDKMVVGDDSPCAYTTSLLGINSFPNSVVNRKTQTDPSAGSLEGVYQEVMAEPVLADVMMEAQWSNQEHTVIRAKAVSRFAGDMTGNYRLAFVLTENEVGPYAQSNYYANSSTAMGGFENMESSVSILHQHVARYIDAFNGTVQSTIVAPKYGEDYSFDTPVNLRNNIQNKDNIELIVLLMDASTSEIVNANRLAAASIKEYSPALGISVLPIQQTAASDDVYSLSGQKQQSGSNLPAGVYIVGGKKVIFK